MSTPECEDDGGCAGVTVCWVEPDWSESNANVCDCNHWYGYTGDDCLSLSSQSYFMIASTVTQMLIAAVALLVGVMSLQKYLKNTGGFRRNYQFATMALLLLALVLHIVWRGIVCGAVLTPERHDLDARSNDTGKIHEFAIVERVFISLTVMVGALALFNVSLLWIQVAEKSKRLSTKLSQRLAIYQRAVYVMQAVVALGVIVLMAAGLTGFVVFFVLPFVLFLIITYAFGARGLSAVLIAARDFQISNDGKSEQQGGSTMGDRYDKLLRRIRFTATWIPVFLFFTMASGLIYSGFTVFGAGQRAALDPRKPVQFVVAANEGIPFFFLLTLLTCLQYVRGNLKSQVARNQQSSAHEGSQVESSSFVVSSNPVSL